VQSGWEDHFELSSAQSFPDELIAITKSLVSAKFEIRKKALARFLETDPMLKELVALEIVLEVFGRESAPINHTSLYYGSARRRRHGAQELRKCQIVLPDPGQ